MHKFALVVACSTPAAVHRGSVSTPPCWCSHRQFNLLQDLNVGRPGSIPELHRLALQESRVTIFISCYVGTRWAACCSTSVRTHT